MLPWSSVFFTFQNVVSFWFPQKFSPFGRLFFLIIFTKTYKIFSKMSKYGKLGFDQHFNTKGLQLRVRLVSFRRPETLKNVWNFVVTDNWVYETGVLSKRTPESNLYLALQTGTETEISLRCATITTVNTLVGSVRARSTCFVQLTCRDF